MTTNAAPESNVGAVFLATRGMPGMFRSNFDFQLARAITDSADATSAFGECYSTARGVPDGDVEAWIAAWSETAARIEAIGDDCRDRGHRVSAREAYLRASAYWRTANFFLSYPAPPELWRTWERSRDCFRNAIPLLDEHIEIVRIPFGDTTLPAYFMKAEDSDEPRPTVINTGGGDTTGEELRSISGLGAIRRGFHALLVEGPGQCGAFYENQDLRWRPDWEVPMAAVVDYALSRPDVDPERLALAGYSLGGYLAPRAAAFEPRIKAVIANALLADVLVPIKALLGLDPFAPHPRDLEGSIDTSEPIREVILNDFTWRAGYRDRPLAEFLDFLGQWSLAGLEDQLTCPILNVMSVGESETLLGAAHAWFEKLTVPKTERVVTEVDGGEAHCNLNNSALRNQIEFDWLEDVFAA